MAPMTHDESFLRAIREEPDDDGVRLIYADWLEEHGKAERAEFIRGQVTLARTPLGAPGRNELAFRVRLLLDT